MMPGLVPHSENRGQCNKSWYCRLPAELLIKWNSFLYAVLSYFNLPPEFFIHSIIKEAVVWAAIFCWNAILLILNLLICEKPNGYQACTPSPWWNAQDQHSSAGLLVLSIICRHASKMYYRWLHQQSWAFQLKSQGPLIYVYIVNIVFHCTFGDCLMDCCDVHRIKSWQHVQRTCSAYAVT